MKTTLLSNLCEFLSVESSIVKKLLYELKCKDIIVEAANARIPSLRYGSPRKDLLTTVYLICRIKRPQIIVETGVRNGFSSAFILRALEDNLQGELYSIDLPLQESERHEKMQRGSYYPSASDVGWVIPNMLKHRWHLIMGKSRDKLKPLLRSLKSIDIFLHDSKHSYKNMMFEFKTAWPYIKRGGLVMSHDVDRNNAFIDFVKETQSTSSVLSDKFGLIAKSN